MSLGPIVGGVLIEYVGWRSVFWVNLPICALAVVLTALVVPESRSATMRNLDPIGQILGMATLFAIIYTLIEGPASGWGRPAILAFAALAVLTLSGFLYYESRRLDPFIDLHFFRSVPFASATVIAVCAKTPVWQLGAIFALFRVGFSMVNAPVTTAAVSGMPTDCAGAASAIASTSRQIGVSLGVALCGSIAAAAIAEPGSEFMVSARPLWLVCAGLGLAVLALGLYSTTSRAQRSADRLAPLIAGERGHHADART